jgi:hypothetical protein
VKAQKLSGDLTVKIEEQSTASYGRPDTGAFLPVEEYGSGPVDRVIGGNRFERIGLTPLERVF